MQKRPLGNSTISLSAIGLGCMGMSEFYGATDDTESLKTLHTALDEGINFLDTADAYGPFKNEELVGKVVRQRRDEVVLATKFGIIRDLNDPAKRGFSGRPEYVQASCDASLKRLGIDTIDLYYLHRLDQNTPIEETVGAMSELVKAGKVRYIGLSEVSAQTIKRAHAVHPISAVQSEYSLWSRDIEESVIPTCKELGITLVAYSPLGRGFLTGQFQKFEDLSPDDFRRNSPRFMGENFAKNLAIVDLLKRWAEERGITPSQLALAWVLAQGENIVPIPGTKRVSYLKENLGALTITLSKEELAELERISPKEAVAGLRYPEAMMKVLTA
ncbi:aldo/keto reductase [Runella aurantiaca]|uniref:Aldo/keto reductase n=1 Tax=Runella aurantiaca TaxID=2282308 RepID=A0A369IG40_9BACT|nr:aldo/keto reductase [Runella aurantiaca]RDB07297.1 aldo/keto reductase [Runella aurantiaca]